MNKNEDKAKEWMARAEEAGIEDATLAHARATASYEEEFGDGPGSPQYWMCFADVIILAVETNHEGILFEAAKYYFARDASRHMMGRKYLQRLINQDNNEARILFAQDRLQQGKTRQAHALYKDACMNGDAGGCRFHVVKNSKSSSSGVECLLYAERLLEVSRTQEDVALYEHCAELYEENMDLKAQAAAKMVAIDMDTFLAAEDAARAAQEAEEGANTAE